MEDPDSIAVDLGGTVDEKAEAIGRVRELRVRIPSRSAIFLDARSGLVVAGGDVAVGAAAIRHGRIGLTIAGPAAGATAPAGTTTDSTAPPVGANPPRDRATAERCLKASAQQMEALFVQQLFQAMRSNIPTDGLVERGPGEDLFNSMLDQRIADRVAERSTGPRARSTSLFEALRERLGPAADTAR